MRISQREARRLRKRVAELESAESDRRNRWVRDYPGGAQIATGTFSADSRVVTAINTARLLKHAVVATAGDDGVVRFFALPVGK